MNDLIAAAKGQLTPSKSSTALDSALAADSVSFLPYLSMLQKQSNFTNPPHDIKAGNFCLVENKEPKDLGAEVDVMLLEKRPCAWKYSEQENIRLYDMESPVFAEIQAQSRKSREKLEAEGDPSMYSWGGEYLIYIPSTKRCATLFANTKSWKFAAKEDFNHRVESHDLITWYSYWNDPPKSSYAWFTPKTKECATGDQYEVPDFDMINMEIERFQNPEVAEVNTEDSEDQ